MLPEHMPRSCSDKWGSPRHAQHVGIVGQQHHTPRITTCAQAFGALACWHDARTSSLSHLFAGPGMSTSHGAQRGFGVAHTCTRLSVPDLLRSRQVLVAVPTPGPLYRNPDASGVSAGILPSNSEGTKQGVADAKGFTAKMAPADTPSPSQQTQQQQQVPVPQVPQQAGNTKRDKWYAPNFDGLWQRR
jgi:hypothetical protein